MTDFHVMAGADGLVCHPEVRRLRFADLSDALAKGLDDFGAKPSHLLFLGLIYPVMGLVLTRWSAGSGALQMIYPLMSGFALIGPFAAIGLYEISRRREAGLDASWQHALATRHSPALPAMLAVGALLAVIFLAWLGTAQAIFASTFGSSELGTTGLGTTGLASDLGASARGTDGLGAVGLGSGGLEAIGVFRLGGFLDEVLTTERGWRLILLGNAAGFAFAVLVLSTTAVAFPLLLDRDVGAIAAIETSARVVAANPPVMAGWGAIVAGLLVLGALPLFAGLAIVMPVLGHATWHLYRKAVVPANRRPAGR